MLIAIGHRPWCQLGLLYTKHRDYYAKDDPDTLVVQGETTIFNPTIDTGVIATAERDDPAAALSEWHAQFRNDLSSFLDDQVIDQAVSHSRPLELPPREGLRYFAFTDASAGRHDCFTICIAHKERNDKSLPMSFAACVRPSIAMMSPPTLVSFARDYGCHRITGNSYAPGWVQGSFKRAGIHYIQSELTRSELYLEGLPTFSRGLIEIPNHARLLRELRLLERRTQRSGKDSVDHGSGGSDDFANVLFGAIMLSCPLPPGICRIRACIGIDESSAEP